MALWDTYVRTVTEENRPESKRALGVQAKLGRRAYLVGSVGFVVVGLLHTVTHLLELTGPELEQRFNELGDIEVSGTIATSWDLFQGVSSLMGLFSIALGLVSLNAINASGGRPPIGVCLANITMLAAIAAVGVAHLGPLQLYGGIFGITMFALAAIGGRKPSFGG